MTVVLFAPLVLFVSLTCLRVSDSIDAHTRPQSISTGADPTSSFKVPLDLFVWVLQPHDAFHRLTSMPCLCLVHWADVNYVPTSLSMHACTPLPHACPPSPHDCPFPMHACCSMSKCPDAIRCEARINDVLARVSNITKVGAGRWPLAVAAAASVTATTASSQSVH